MRVALSVSDRKTATPRITISDNGKSGGGGMTRTGYEQPRARVAKSGTNEFFSLANLSGDQAKDSQLMRQFGVGFYSGFFVADRVTVGAWTRAA